MASSSLPGLSHVPQMDDDIRTHLNGGSPASFPQPHLPLPRRGSARVSSNHSPFFRRSANRRCQTLDSRRITRPDLVNERRTREAGSPARTAADRRRSSAPPCGGDPTSACRRSRSRSARRHRGRSPLAPLRQLEVARLWRARPRGRDRSGTSRSARGPPLLPICAFLHKVDPYPAQIHRHLNRLPPFGG